MNVGVGTNGSLHGPIGANVNINAAPFAIEQIGILTLIHKNFEQEKHGYLFMLHAVIGKTFGTCTPKSKEFQYLITVIKGKQT